MLLGLLYPIQEKTQRVFILLFQLIHLSDHDFHDRVLKTYEKVLILIILSIIYIVVNIISS